MREIVIYLQPNISVEVKHNQFYSPDLSGLEALNSDLRQFNFTLKRLGSKKSGHSDELGLGPEIFFLLTSDDSNAIVELLEKHEQIIQSAYIKPPGVDSGDVRDPAGKD